MAERPDSTPFPIGSLAGRIVRALFDNRSELLARAVVPVAAWVVLLRLGTAGFIAEGHQQKVFIAAIVGGVVVVLHFVVSWHRLLQLGPEFAGHRFGFWIGDSEWKLIGHGILFVVFWFVIHFAIGWIDGRLGAVIGWIAWVAGNLLFYAFLSRHLLMFPMTAVDEEAKFGGSWDLTRPCWGAFVSLIALFGVPMAAIVLVAVPVLNPGAVGLEVSLLIQGMAVVSAAAVMGTVLSVTYMELRPDSPTGEGQPGAGPATR